MGTTTKGEVENDGERSIYLSTAMGGEEEETYTIILVGILKNNIYFPPIYFSFSCIAEIQEISKEKR